MKKNTMFMIFVVALVAGRAAAQNLFEWRSKINVLQDYIDPQGYYTPKGSFISESGNCGGGTIVGSDQVATLTSLSGTIGTCIVIFGHSGGWTVPPVCFAQDQTGATVAGMPTTTTWNLNVSKNNTYKLRCYASI